MNATTTPTPVVCGALVRPDAVGWWMFLANGFGDDWRPAMVTTHPEWDGLLKVFLWGGEWFWCDHINQESWPQLPGSKWLPMNWPNVKNQAREPSVPNTTTAP